jgi:hypothetical protein
MFSSWHMRASVRLCMISPRIVPSLRCFLYKHRSLSQQPAGAQLGRFGRQRGYASLVKGCNAVDSGQDVVICSTEYTMQRTGAETGLRQVKSLLSQVPNLLAGRRALRAKAPKMFVPIRGVTFENRMVRSAVSSPLLDCRLGTWLICCTIIPCSSARSQVGPLAEHTRCTHLIFVQQKGRGAIKAKRRAMAVDCLEHYRPTMLGSHSL